jgi:HSP20 family molecular chaperone IbpA
VNLAVTDKPHAFLITGTVPGLQMKDIKVKVEDNKLIITGFREPSQVRIGFGLGCCCSSSSSL